MGLGAAGLLAAAGAVGTAALHGAPRRPAAALPEPDVCIVAPPTPYDPASGLPVMTARPVPPDARCPVCGMYPARAPEWAAQLIFANGNAHFFDSPLSFFLYLRDVERYSPGMDAEQIAALYVTDASVRGALRWIDARTAFYVHGSDARGPMRAGNLPAFATRAAAQAFVTQRGGRVLEFEGVDAALVAQLAAPGGHRH